MKTIIRQNTQKHSFQKLFFWVCFCILMLSNQKTYAALSHNNYAVSKAENSGNSKVTKAFLKKEKNAKKRHLERFRFKVNHVGTAVLIAGVLLFVLGLALKIKALWILGLCITIFPFFILLVIGLVLIIGLATYSGGLC